MTFRRALTSPLLCDLYHHMISNTFNYSSIARDTTTSTDHLYMDMKLTDIGWPTKTLLPSIPHYRF